MRTRRRGLRLRPLVDQLDDRCLLSNLTPATLTAAYGDARIHAIAASPVEGNGKNGAPRLAVSFSKDDLGTLFAALPDGKVTVDVIIRGSLASGGSFKAITSVRVEKGEPRSLGRASPNPLNPITMIRFELGRQGHIRLRVYDVSGRHVSTLVDRVMDVGFHEVRWDGTSTDGSRVSSGVYYYVLETPEGSERSRIVVAK